MTSVPNVNLLSAVLSYTLLSNTALFTCTAITFNDRTHKLLLMREIKGPGTRLNIFRDSSELRRARHGSNKNKNLPKENIKESNVITIGDETVLQNQRARLF